MKFTLAWLKEHLETDRSLGDIVQKLSMIGLEVENVIDCSQTLSDFCVGQVVSAEKHPNADRLKVCMVNCGDEELVQVVCGAPNARAGIKAVFAPSGTYIANIDLTLKKSVIRGQESNGMLLSEREMGLSDDHEGIVEINDSAEVGSLAAEAMGLSDPLIEIGLTPNRQDCAGVRGIARDLAASGLGILRPLDPPIVTGSFSSPIQWERDFSNNTENACPLVLGRYFRGVQNCASPPWLKERLKAIGLRPISALVDITNYITFDLARPLHVFDASKITGNLTMRLAGEGETIKALDGAEYHLETSMAVISDKEGVQAIGGIIGGMASGVTEDTKDVFLEVALFDPVRVATTGRKLGVMSDARYRFERGVDPQSAYWGEKIATKMILDVCGGEASEITMAGEIPSWQREIALRKSRVFSLGGIEVEKHDQLAILGDLGFDPVEEEEMIRVSVPSWRHDIDGEADLVEEVLRIKGYEDIPVVPMVRKDTIASPAWSPSQRRESDARRALAVRGMTEAVTFSFMKRELARLFGFDNEALVIDNPISTDLEVLRPSILPNLLDALYRNAGRGYKDLSLFEVGPQYVTDQEDGQQTVAATIRSGKYTTRHWGQVERDVDAWDSKADAYAALGAGSAPLGNLKISTDAPIWYHPGRSGVFRLGSTILASFGDIHPSILQQMDIEGPVVGSEVYLNAIPLPRHKKISKGSRSARPLLHLSPFQTVYRDFAFIVQSTVQAGEIVRVARGVDKDLITDVEVFDVYSGEHVGEGRKSVAISVTLQPKDRTLTEKQIEAVVTKIMADVKKYTGGVLRA